MGALTALRAREDTTHMEHFIDNDEGYFAWLAAHPDGFVVNCNRKPDRQLPGAPSRTLPPHTAVGRASVHRGLWGGVRHGRADVNRLGGADRRGTHQALLLQAVDTAAGRLEPKMARR